MSQFGTLALRSSFVSSQLDSQTSEKKKRGCKKGTKRGPYNLKSRDTLVLPLRQRLLNDFEMPEQPEDDA
jgi:hypothetical protein